MNKNVKKNKTYFCFTRLRYKLLKNNYLKIANNSDKYENSLKMRVIK